MSNVVRKNLGPVTAYKYAVSKGFTGTEEEFAELMASYDSIAEDVTAESRVAEGYALGKQNGVDVGSQSPYYHANAKWYAEQAAASAETLVIDDTLSHAGQAADSLETGNKIRDLIKYNSFDLLRLFGTFTSRTSGGVVYTWNEDHTICSAVGTTTTLSITNLYNGDTLPQGMIAGGKYKIKCNTTDLNLLFEITAYNGNNSLDDSFITGDVEYTVPESTTRLLMRIRTRYSSSQASTVNASISVSIFAVKTNKELEEDIDKLNAKAKSLDKPTMQFMQIFPRYTTIGDSLMGGFMNRSGVSVNTATARDAGNNWVNYIAIRIGRTFTNLAVGGSTAKQWRESLISDANIDTDCYIIGLGVNDHRNELEIGSSEDIANDFHNNEDSFYGNYDFILRQLMAWKEKAHIFCFTIPEIEGGTSPDYNTAIKAVTSLYPTKVHCVDLADGYAELFADNIVIDNYSGKHFNPIAYSYMSTVIERSINDYIRDNNELFATAPYA